MRARASAPLVADVRLARRRLPAGHLQMTATAAATGRVEITATSERASERSRERARARAPTSQG